MIISEKQIVQLMQFAQVYLNALDTLHKYDTTLLTNCGLHNKIAVAQILMEIVSQQSKELKEVE